MSSWQKLIKLYLLLFFQIFNNSVFWTPLGFHFDLIQCSKYFNMIRHFSTFWHLYDACVARQCDMYVTYHRHEYDITVINLQQFYVSQYHKSPTKWYRILQNGVMFFSACVTLADQVLIFFFFCNFPCQFCPSTQKFIFQLTNPKTAYAEVLIRSPNESRGVQNWDFLLIFSCSVNLDLLLILMISRKYHRSSYLHLLG